LGFKFGFAAVFSILLLSFLGGPALAETITLDAVADAGLSPGQSPYIRFVDDTNYTPLMDDLLTNPGWDSADDVYEFAKPLSSWLLASAGDFGNTDSIVGESLTDLAAGTYRISPLSGNFTYDSWGWSSFHNLNYWLLDIRLLDSAGANFSDYRLFTPNLTQNQYLDIFVMEGGSLNFWIWDWNSIDNSGSLTFEVVPVPEPSTLTLLSLILCPALAVAIWRQVSSRAAAKSGL